MIDQHQVKIDVRSGSVNDPHRADDPEYIVRLVKQSVTVSVETLRLVAALPVYKGVSVVWIMGQR